jgi:hypothetical protein
VLADARSLKSRVGSADQKKLDEFLSSVRQVETQIANKLKSMAGQQAALRQARRSDIEQMARRVSDQRGGFRDADVTDRVRLMMDILVLAFWTDSTRIASFMFGNEVTGRNFSFIPGVSGGFHDISHHGNDADKLEQYKKINQWHAQQFAYLVEKMKSIKEGSKTLLDNAMVLFGSGISDGNAHSPHNLPLVLAGRGGGTITPGRSIQYAKGSPLSNLYVSMLNRMGVPAPRFADSNKPELPNLKG